MGPLEPNYFCRAWNGKRGKYCKARAGSGTNHPGIGRCKFHGGNEGTLKHGRYSTIRHERLADKLEQYAADPEPLNMLRDLALMRALVEDYIERAEASRDALLAWYHSFSDEYRDELRRAREQWVAAGAIEPFLPPLPISERPRQVLDLADAGKLVAEVTKIVERIEKVRAQYAITYDQLRRFLFGVESVIRQHVSDESVVERIRAGLLTLRP